MVKAHSPINWENEPSTNTPINEANLNKMDSTIGILDDRIIEQETSKLDKSIAYTMVKDISFNENNGVFTITLLNGSTKTLDTKLEKISINFDYNAETQQIEIILIDGTKQYIDISSLISPIDFVDSDTIGWEVTEDGKVKAKVLDGSITEDMLQPNYLAEIKVETAKSEQSMANAKISENNAKQSELNAKASEEQALEYSNNAQPLAQSVSGNNPIATNSANGKPTYLNNKGYTQQDGAPSPNNPIHIGASADKGYFDGELRQGALLVGDGSYDSSRPNTVCSKNGISCNENDTIELRYEEVTNMLCVFYYGDNGYISSDTASDTNILTSVAPSGTTYFHIRVDKNHTLTPSTAKHICVTINGMYALRVKTQNKNLLDCSNLVETTLHDVKCTPVYENGFLQYISLVGTASGWVKYLLNTITLDAGTYILNTNRTEANCFLQVFFNGSIFAEGENKQFTLTEATRVQIFLIGQIDKTFNGKAYPMIRLASITDDTYEPHQETTALIPISAPFYEGDYIEVYADGSGQIVRENKVYENPTLTNSSGLWYWFNGGGVLKPYTNCYCNKLNHADNKIGTDEKGDVVLQLLEGQSIDDLATSIFVCKLAEPIITPLTAEQVAEFMKLQTFKGVTHVTADGEVIMRYYCDNASGETVSMLQGMVEETNDILKTYSKPRFEIVGIFGQSFSIPIGSTLAFGAFENISQPLTRLVRDANMYVAIPQSCTNGIVTSMSMNDETLKVTITGSSETAKYVSGAALILAIKETEE